MKTEEKKTPTPTAPFELAKQPIVQFPAPTLPWEDYLTGKKSSAVRFLAKMESAKKKDGISIPDDSTKKRFADAVVLNPGRVARLVTLLQACAQSSETVRGIVVEFAEVSIKRLLGTISFREPLDALGFRNTILSWLGTIPKKPLKTDQLNLLFLLLLFGQHRQIIDHDMAMRLVGSAVSKTTKNSTKKKLKPRPAPTLQEVLLGSTPSASVLSALVRYYQASKTAMDKLNTKIISQDEEITKLTFECNSLKIDIKELCSDITILKEQQTADQTRISELERQIVEISDGYQHKLDDLRGRIRGMLQGQLMRMLQTALDASQTKPLWIEAVQEHLEDAIKLIEKEIQWLRPSA